MPMTYTEHMQAAKYTKQIGIRFTFRQIAELEEMAKKSSKPKTTVARAALQLGLAMLAQQDTPKHLIESTELDVLLSSKADPV